MAMFYNRVSSFPSLSQPASDDDNDPPVLQRGLQDRLGSPSVGNPFGGHLFLVDATHRRDAGSVKEKNRHFFFRNNA